MSLWASSSISYFAILALLLTQKCISQSDISNAEDANLAGASGSSSESVNLSRKGLIILCTVVAVVAVIGLASAALFLIAKRRQWAMREAIRRSARRVAEAIKTPLTPRFPKSPKPLKPVQSRSDTRTRDQPKSEKRSKSHRHVDPEMGFKTEIANSSTIEVNIEGGSVEKHRSKAKGWGSFFSFGRN